jgi:hypothetical protein
MHHEVGRWHFRQRSVPLAAAVDDSHNGRPNEAALARFLATAPQKSRVRFVVAAGISAITSAFIRMASSIWSREAGALSRVASSMSPKIYIRIKSSQPITMSNWS